MRSEAQTLKGCDRKRATQADLHFAMAKQHMLPLLRRLTNLRTEAATGRTRRNYGVGRELTGEELSRRKTEIEAGTVDWAGEKNVCSAYACPALRLLGTPSLPTRLLGDSPSAIATHDSLTKNFGVRGAHAAKRAILPAQMPESARGRAKKNGPVKKEWQVGQDNDSRSRRPRTARTGADGAVVPARTGGLRAALARGRAADPGGPALLLPPGPAASQQGLRLQPALTHEVRGPTTTSAAQRGRRSSCAPCRAESAG